MMNLKSFFKASAIVDNNILIDLFELDSVGLLFEVFSCVGIPLKIIQDELDERIKDQLDEYQYDVCVMETEEAYRIYADLTNNSKYKRLSKQDKHLISIAKQYDFLAGSNDGLVRKTCIEFDIDHIGTLGIIGSAFMQGIIDRVSFIKMLGLLSSDETTCYIKQELIDEFIKSIDIVINQEERR